jgi:hypothetical protein
MSKIESVGARAGHAARMRELVGKFDPEKETQVGFCRKRGLSLSTFLYWRKRMQGSVEGTAGLVEVTVNPEADGDVGFEIQLGSTMTAHFPGCVSQETLRRFFLAVKTSC